MKRITPILFLGILLFFLIEPSLILSASKSAIETWFHFVLPALLPFFILNQLCLTYGTVEFMGKALSPIVRHLFRLPKETAYVIATGYTTGAPVSSIAIAALRKDHMISKVTGEFLLPFTANVSPLFIFSVVAAGFLLHPSLGMTLAFVHYGTNLAMGFLLFRFLLPNQLKHHNAVKHQEKKPFPPLGKGLSTAVAKGIETITLIGGLMILFFIFITMAEFFHIIDSIAHTLAYWNIPTSLTRTLLIGITEITAGIQCAAVMDTSFLIKLSAISGILAFGGISAFFQIATQIQDTDLSLKPYIIYKAIQATIAYGITMKLPLLQEVSTFPKAPLEPWTFTLIYLIFLAFYLSLLFLSIIIHHLPHRR